MNLVEGKLRLGVGIPGHLSLCMKHCISVNVVALQCSFPTLATYTMYMYIYACMHVHNTCMHIYSDVGVVPLAPYMHAHEVYM